MKKIIFRISVYNLYFFLPLFVFANDQSGVIGVDWIGEGNFLTTDGTTREEGISGPEVKRYSGDIIYVDNRPSIVRSVNQKEDIKVILQF